MRYLMLAAAGLLVGAGCSTSDSVSQVAPPEAAATPQGTTDSAQPAGDDQAAAKVSLTQVDPKEFQAELARHQGKVVLVDFWATWCEPCKENFPHMLELLRDHQPRGLVLVTLSCDEPDAVDPVREFLVASRAFDAVNLLTKLDIAATFEAYEIPSGIPYYVAYDRSGKQRFSFTADPDSDDEALPLDQIDEKVAQLLSE